MHCLAAEPRETLLRFSVQDLTHSSGDQDVVYEAVVLDALRPGYRSLPLRSAAPNRGGCRVDMCCLYVHVAISQVEIDPKTGEMLAV